MNRPRLPFVAALLFCLTPVCAAQIIVPTFEASRLYFRPTIKSYPADEGRPLLQYLDAARVAADEGMRLFAAGKADELYKSMTADYKERYGFELFRRQSQIFEQALGRIVSYEYRNQALSFPLLDDAPLSDLAKATSDVHYAFKTNKLSDEGVFMRVRTTRVGGRHVVSNINLRDHRGNIPPWLLYPDAPAPKE